MRSAQILALAGIAAAQSTTVVIDQGITTTIVLPVWSAENGPGAGEATATLIVPTPLTSVEISVDLPDTTTTVVVDETDVVDTVTAIETPTSLVTSTVSVVPNITDTPPVVTANGASSLGAGPLVGLLAFAAAGLAML